MKKLSKRYRAMTLAAPVLAVFPLPLTSILRFSRSDKEGKEAHHYGSMYTRLFRRLKYRRLTLLEIGIGGYNEYLGGNSLAAWQLYFPFGKIIGCDILDKRLLSGGRIHVKVVDQSSSADLSRLSEQEGPFDIIIDDGSHVNSHQLLTFQTLFQCLKSSGIYVIEDAQTSYWPDYGGKPVGQQSVQTAMGYFTELAKYINHAEFLPGQDCDKSMLNIAKTISSVCFQHNLIVITKMDE